jgi:hypothetical protein
VIEHLKIKEELLNRIRSADIISTILREVTTATDTFSGNGVLKTFTLTNFGIKNIRSVAVGGVTLTALVDYTYTLTEADSVNKVINFEVAPESGTNNIVISYDYSSSGDRIYDDFSMYTIKSEDKFPRIAFDIISESTRDKALQGAVYQSTLQFQFSVFGRGKNETEEIISSLRNFLVTNKLSFKRVNYLATRGVSRMDVWLDGGTFKIMKKSLQFSAPYEFIV